MDCDIVVRGSLTDLWNLNINDCALAAVYQNDEWGDDKNVWGRLNIPKEKGYFNAGVLIINLDYWRANNIQELLFDFIKYNYNKILAHDQDVLNAVLYDKTLPLDCKWNVLGLFYSEGLMNNSFPRNLDYKQQFFNGININPTVVHYVFKPKPWEYTCNHPFREDYFHYLLYTPWKNYKPSFSWSKYYNYIMRPFLFKIIIKADVLKLRRIIKNKR